MTSFGLPVSIGDPGLVALQDALPLIAQAMVRLQDDTRQQMEETLHQQLQEAFRKQAQDTNEKIEAALHQQERIYEDLRQDFQEAEERLQQQKEALDRRIQIIEDVLKEMENNKPATIASEERSRKRRIIAPLRESDSKDGVLELLEGRVAKMEESVGKALETVFPRVEVLVAHLEASSRPQAASSSDCNFASAAEKSPTSAPGRLSTSPPDRPSTPTLCQSNFTVDSNRDYPSISGPCRQIFDRDRPSTSAPDRPSTSAPDGPSRPTSIPERVSTSAFDWPSFPTFTFDRAISNLSGPPAYLQSSPSYIPTYSPTSDQPSLIYTPPSPTYFRASTRSSNTTSTSCSDAAPSSLNSASTANRPSTSTSEFSASISRPLVTPDFFISGAPAPPANPAEPAAQGEELMEAAMEGRLQDVRRLLETGANVNFSRADGITPLMRASYYEHASVVSLLLQMGADVNMTMNNGDTALHFAARDDRWGQCAALLLNAGSNVDSKNSSWWTPLHMAACYGNENVVHLLLRAGASKSILNNCGQRPLDVTVIESIRRLIM